MGSAPATLTSTHPALNLPTDTMPDPDYGWIPGSGPRPSGPRPPPHTHTQKKKKKKTDPNPGQWSNHPRRPKTYTHPLAHGL